MIPVPTKADEKLLDISTIRRKTAWYRISDPGHPTPLYFNTDQTGRWNSPASEYGVCYVADTPETAFAETFGRDLMGKLIAGQPKIISEERLASRHLYNINVIETLYVGEMNGNGLANLTLDNSINTTKDYGQVHPWSKWVYYHPNTLDGIRYQSRHISTERCVGIFDRAVNKIETEDQGPLDKWHCDKTGRTIDDILEEQGWVIG